MTELQNMFVYTSIALYFVLLHKQHKTMIVLKLQTVIILNFIKTNYCRTSPFDFDSALPCSPHRTGDCLSRHGSVFQLSWLEVPYPSLPERALSKCHSASLDLSCYLMPKTKL